VARGGARFFASLGAFSEDPVDFRVGNYRQALAKANDPELSLLYERVARALGYSKYPKRLDQLKAAATHAALFLLHGGNPS
jgi:hypothetical protein